MLHQDITKASLIITSFLCEVRFDNLTAVYETSQDAAWSVVIVFKLYLFSIILTTLEDVDLMHIGVQEVQFQVELF